MTFIVTFVLATLCILKWRLHRFRKHIVQNDLVNVCIEDDVYACQVIYIRDTLLRVRRLADDATFEVTINNVYEHAKVDQ